MFFKRDLWVSFLLVITEYIADLVLLYASGTFLKKTVVISQKYVFLPIDDMTLCNKKCNITK